NIISGLPPYAAITPSLSTEEPDNSLSIGDKHLDTIPATELDEFIKSSVKNLIPIPSESEGVPDNMCDVPFHDNSLPPNVSKDQYKDFSDSPILSTEEPIDSLSIGDEHLDTIPTTESDEVIKSSVENLVPIPSESEGIPEHMCDVPFHDNSPPLDVSNDQIEDFSESNNEVS
nr:hypothetical protein [Tanacetum cinerariifolium]